MRNLRIFFIAISFFRLPSFLWEDEEKQLRQLYQTAEASWQSKNLSEAKEAYEKILNKIDIGSSQKYQVDWITYIDIVLRYTEAASQLEMQEDVEKAFSKLFSKNPPREYLPKIRLAQSKFTLNQKTPERAYIELKETEKLYPEYPWKQEDLSFLHALEFTLDSYYDNLFQKAVRLFACQLYAEASPLFEEILKALEEETYPKAKTSPLLSKKIKLKSADCYFNQAKYEKSLELCETETNEDKIDCEMIYLAALSFQKKEEYEKSLLLFERYLQSKDENELQHYDHALFEVGHFYYKAQNLPDAKKTFELLCIHHFDPQKKPLILASFFLSKIYLKENLAEKVEELLAKIAPHFKEKDPLQYECHYLRGEAAFQLGKFEEAIVFFEKSIPKTRPSPKWAEAALYNMGFCYLSLGDVPSLAQEKKKEFFGSSEAIFKKLVSTEKSEEAKIALGRLYLAKKRHFSEKIQENIEALFETSFEKMARSLQLEVLLLKAEASETYEEREKIFQTATVPLYQELPSYPLAWHLRGLNHFEEGLKKEGDFFELAIFSFEKAVRLYEKKDPKLAAATLKLEAKAHFYNKAPLSSLAGLEKLLCQFQEDSKEREESLYLKGLIAGEIPSHFQIAEEAFLQVIQGFPNGAFLEKALHMLGRLYYREDKFKEAKETFLQLIAKYPHSTFAEESYFWAAESAEKLKEDFRDYRKKIYELYPDSPRAADSYFREYAYTSYFNGDPIACAHLKEFPFRFGNSPLLVMVHYLLGVNEKNFEKAKKSFEDAESAYITFFSKEKTPDLKGVYFRYLARLELAQLYLWERKEQKRSTLTDVAISFSHEPEETHFGFSEEENPPLESIEKALLLVSSIVDDFSNPHHAAAQLLKTKMLYPPIFEESEFTLALCYLKLHKNQKAEETFLKMLEHYKEAGVDKGFFLARVWKEQGKMAGVAKDFDTAIRCLKIAEECGQGYLTQERKLALWMLQSRCFREKGEFGVAMRLLSNVINSDIASPLRLKAMFMRAEIYELQGRHELAIRQLEWAAKKGDAESAEKLRIRYGI